MRKLRRSLERRPAAPDLAPRRPARRRGVPRSSTGSPRPGSRGGRSCRSARPTSTARPYRAASAFAVLARRCSREPDARGDRATRSRRFVARAPATGSRDWAAFAGDGRARRPGALRARVGARCARTRAERGVAAHRRRADLRRARRAPTTRAHPELFQRRRGRRRRRRTTGARPASSGATRSTTGRRIARDAATAGGSSGSAARSSSSTSCAIDHFRGFVAYWAVPDERRDARARAAGAAGPGRELFDAVAARARRRCRWSPRTSA